MQALVYYIAGDHFGSSESKHARSLQRFLNDVLSIFSPELAKAIQYAQELSQHLRTPPHTLPSTNNINNVHAGEW